MAYQTTGAKRSDMIVKFVTVMLFAGLSAYAQGHPGGGMSHGGGTPAGTTSPGRGMPGSQDNAGNGSMGSAGRRPIETGNVSNQSPHTILQRNTKLSSRLEGLLPAGSTAEQACSGFKHLGECVSAIHVSHNLGIPFADLKAKMTGTDPERLGKSIHDLKPDISAKNEAKKAQKQAKSDIEETSDPTS